MPVSLFHTRRSRWTVVLSLLVVMASSGAAYARATVPARAPSAPAPGTYTWRQAVALGLPAVRDFARPAGVPFCPRSIGVRAADVRVGHQPPANGPVCFVRPEQQGLAFVVGEQAAGRYARIPQRGLVVFGYRYAGSIANLFNFEGAQNLAEVSNPSLCHGCGVPKHYYSRIQLVSSGNNSVQVGWVETNHDQGDQDRRFVLTVTAQGSSESPVFHTSWTLNDGGSYAFRARQCGSAGQLSVCMEIWNGSSWSILRTWNGVMRCENSDGSGNCQPGWLDEAFAADEGWFNVNGGSDGLRMQNIQVRTAAGNWFLFDQGLGFSGAWVEESPYSICRVHAWYHFTSFRGTPSC